jgi:chemotaxis protein MotB
MMAFFLVMWLMGATTNKERAAISEYFRNPSPLSGKSFSPAPGPAGPGGASTSMIKLGGTMDLPKGENDNPFAKPPGDAQQVSEEQQKAQEKQRLETLMQALQEAIGKSQALEPFKDQLLLDLTPEGLRIQIVDQQNRPMFDLGGTTLKPYTQTILGELAGFINQVPNRVSITGHTDTTAYAGNRGYTNWELSAERANAARRALVTGGMQEEKVSRVVGLSSSVLFDKQNPQNPINRRISIVVMTKAADEGAQGAGDMLALGRKQADADTAMPAMPVAVPAATAAVPAAATPAAGAHP